MHATTNLVRLERGFLYSCALFTFHIFGFKTRFNKERLEFDLLVKTAFIDTLVLCWKSRKIV